jgi:hypothetical protein
LQKQKKAKITDIKNSFIAKIKQKSWVSFLLPVLFQATWQTTTNYPTDATTKQTAKRANVQKNASVDLMLFIIMLASIWKWYHCHHLMAPSSVICCNPRDVPGHHL